MVTQAEALENPEENLGRDIALDDTSDLKIGASDDYQLITTQDNLKQAMINRLRTAKGELQLNPNYGSRLHEVLGTNPTEDTLVLVKAHTREALLQEPRIETINSIAVTFRDNQLKQEIDVEVNVTPIEINEPLNLLYFLELFLFPD